MIRATPNGLFYASWGKGLGAGTLVWGSSDGGNRYASLLSPDDASVGSTSTGKEAGLEPGGGDRDVAVASATDSRGNCNAYVASLTLASVDGSTSIAKGTSWTLNPAAAIPIDDRPWIAATGASRVRISTSPRPECWLPSLACTSAARTTPARHGHGLRIARSPRGRPAARGIFNVKK